MTAAAAVAAAAAAAAAATAVVAVAVVAVPSRTKHTFNVRTLNMCLELVQDPYLDPMILPSYRSPYQSNP
uniref:Uncharacterized protein n=1 Tax=Vespula pensylvanica TaxID=30213 RepID=A0A834N9R1_VESPE|nr:hypothetical protein H0235_015321 [Vespula pensylvanica]